MRPILIAGLLTFGSLAQAQTEPSPLIQLVRRPGVDASAIRRYVDARAEVNVLGMVSVTGPPETWLVATHDSFAGIQGVDKAVRLLTALHDPSDQLPADLLAV